MTTAEYKDGALQSINGTEVSNLEKSESTQFYSRPVGQYDSKFTRTGDPQPGLTKYKAQMQSERLQRAFPDREWRFVQISTYTYNIQED